MVTLIFKYFLIGTHGALIVCVGLCFGFFFLHFFVNFRHYNCSCGIKDKLLQYSSHMFINLSILILNCF